MSERQREEQGIILLPRSEPRVQDVDVDSEERHDKNAILVQSAERIDIRARYVVVEDKNDKGSLQYVAMLG